MMERKQRPLINLINKAGTINGNKYPTVNRLLKRAATDKLIRAHKYPRFVPLYNMYIDTI